MSVLSKLASAQNRQDEAPNIQLVQELADNEDQESIQELVANLSHKDKAISSDCIKVLYEIGERKPELIVDHVEAFIKLLKSKNNRLVWGAMTALGSIAPLKADLIWNDIETIIQTTKKGSAITQDWGIRVLASVASMNADYSARIFPFLLDFLGSRGPKDVPRHAESMMVAVNDTNRETFLALLEKRQPALLPAPAKRVDKLIKQLRV